MLSRDCFSRCCRGRVNIQQADNKKRAHARFLLSACWMLYLDRHGDSTTATEAESCEATTTTTTAQFVNQRNQHAGATGADRVAEGDSTTVDIDPRPIPVKFLAVCQRLRGEGFIDLDQVEITDFSAGALQKAIDGASWSGENIARRDSRGSIASDTGHDVQAVGAGEIRVYNNGCRCAVAQAGRVACRNCAICLEGRFEFC